MWRLVRYQFCTINHSQVSPSSCWVTRVCWFKTFHAVLSMQYLRSLRQVFVVLNVKWLKLDLYWLNICLIIHLNTEWLSFFLFFIQFWTESGSGSGFIQNVNILFYPAEVHFRYEMHKFNLDGFEISFSSNTLNLIFMYIWIDSRLHEMYIIHLTL